MAQLFWSMTRILVVCTGGGISGQLWSNLDTLPWIPKVNGPDRPKRMSSISCSNYLTILRPVLEPAQKSKSPRIRGKN